MKKLIFTILILLASYSQSECQNNESTVSNKKVVVFRGWALDLNQLKLIGINDYTKKEIVWDVDNEPSYWGDKNTKRIERGDFIPVKSKDSIINYIKIEEIIAKDVIYGYQISSWDITKKIKQWTFSDTLHGIAACGKVILCDQKLYIASFDFISTGSGLVCLNQNTGTPVWNAKVTQMLVDHSEYSNDIFLNKIDDLIILVGDEAGGKYIQVFNAKTGENIFTEMKKYW
ncbi:MAG: hypothetical protein WCP69_14160 [Bacteroidota bacterium]